MFLRLIAVLAALLLCSSATYAQETLPYCSGITYLDRQDGQAWLYNNQTVQFIPAEKTKQLSKSNYTRLAQPGNLRCAVTVLPPALDRNKAPQGAMYCVRLISRHGGPTLDGYAKSLPKVAGENATVPILMGNQGVEFETAISSKDGYVEIVPLPDAG